MTARLTGSQLHGSEKETSFWKEEDPVHGRKLAGQSSDQLGGAELNMPKEETLKIGLVTPYTGGNLGDGTIQDAVIGNLKSILPDASFCLFTLDPQTTAALHGIPSLPVAREIVSCYSDNPEQPPGSGTHCKDPSRPSRTLASWLKSHSFLWRLLRPPWSLVKRILILPTHLGREIRHVMQMYSLLRGYKLLVVSGGGQIDDYWGGPMGHPYALLKWGLLAKAARIKFVFLSVGVGSLDSRLSSIFAETALRLADYRSYRDIGSKQLLHSMEFTHADPVIPDLAFSYHPGFTAASVARNGSGPRLRIGISPIIYLHKDHWPKSDATTFSQYAENLESFIVQLLGDGHEVVLFESDAPDREATKLLVSRLESRPHSERTKLQVTKVGRVPELFSELTNLDCVVASRLHGVILSHLCLKPVLAISYERKVKQHMKEMEQESYCLDIHHLRIEELRAAFDSLLSSRERARAIIEGKVEEYRTKLTSQYDNLARVVQPRTKVTP